MAVIHLLCFLLTSILHVVAAYDDPLVHLDYGTFQGKYNPTYNISYFRRIPFGASTAGPNRFRAPQPPPPILNGTYDTDQSFDMCPQRTVNGSEDCLYLGLYSRPWTPPSLRPVLVVFYGGGFIEGSASFSIPPSFYPTLNVSTENDFIIVYPNYRVNAFGFLPGRKIKESNGLADLNVGLLDQQAALGWVHNHISAFGGDPGNVTIQGQSAGGGSVVSQVIANGGKTQPQLFSRALAGSPFWPKTYAYDDPEAEQLYDLLVNMTGCGNLTEDSLVCLKNVDVQVIRNASLAISGLNTYTTSSYNWAPVIDGSFIRSPLTSLLSGEVNPQVSWAMYNTHEGENFIPSFSGANDSEAGFDSWLRGYLPRFNEVQIGEVKKLYPLNGTTENTILNTTSVRAGMVYRDTVLSCPGLWIAETSGKGYIGEYTIPPARHGSDTQFVRTCFPSSRCKD